MNWDDTTLAFYVCCILASAFVALASQAKTIRKIQLFCAGNVAHKTAGLVPKLRLGETYATANCY